MSADPEIRIDQLTGLRTILAPARAERPIEFVSERPPRPSEAANRDSGPHGAHEAST